MATLQDAGRAILTNRIIGSGTEPNFLALGSGSTAEGHAQTALVTEYTTGTWSGYTRVTGTATQQTTTVTNDTYQVVGTFTAPASETVAEAGCFDASSSGNMLIRGLTGTVALSSGDSIQLTVKLIFS